MNAAETQVGTVAGLAEIGEEEWNRLVPDEGFYSSHAWLLTQEAVRVTYLTVRRDGRLIGGLPLYRFRTSRRAQYAERFGRDCDLLFAGPRTGNRTHFLLDPDLPSGERRAVCGVLVAAARDLAVEYGYDGVVFDCLTNEGLRLLCSVADPAVAFRTGDAEIDTGGADLDTVLAGLPGATRRKIGREIRRFEEAGWRTGEERMTDCLTESAALLSRTEQKYGHEMAPEYIEEFFALTAKFTDDLSVVFTCRDEAGELLGYTMAFRWRDTLYGRVVGFDYPRLRGSFEYFNLTFYRPISYLHRHGMRRLHLGVLASEAKIRRGAVVRPLWAAALFGTDPAPSPGVTWQDLTEFRAYADGMREVLPAAVPAAEWDITALLNG